MVYEITDLTQLDSSEVQSLLAQTISRLEAENPTLDLKRGVLHDSVAYYHAVLEAAIRTNLDRYLSARSLQQIEADPTIADDTTVDDVLSNWGITREVGTQAQGEVSIVVGKSTSVTISAGAVFEADGLSFVADDSYTSTTNPASVSNDSDRLMTQLGDGNWQFTVFVTASDAGAAGKLKTNASITPQSTISNYVTSFVTADFSGGTNTETNTELINQLQDGIAAKTLSNRVNMRGLIRSLSQFSTVTNQSIVGYGDSEMLRDKHSIFPLSYGGRVDWYARGQASLQTVKLTKEATLISIDSAGQGTWQFALLKDDAPGFYEVTRVVLATADVQQTGTFSVTSDVRGLDLTGAGFIPDIKTQAEGAYTAYQTATIQFLDTVTDTSTLVTGDKQDYSVDVTNTPLIKELQTYVGSRDVRNYGADALVKAPVPCFVQISCTVNKSAADADPDTNGIKTTIAELVNGTGFIGRLDGSRLLDIIHGYIQNDVSVTDLDILGRILMPDGSTKWLRDSSSIVVVEDASNMVTAKTVQFFADSSDISVNIQTSIPTFA
jgi:uncharacterized phage protein gp47/JayE